MAIEFPLSTYPLDPATRFVEEHNVARDKDDDGEMNIRILGMNKFRVLRCTFTLMSNTNAALFEQYLRDNADTEFFISYEGKTYTGYIWTDPKIKAVGSVNSQVSFDFRGKIS